MPRILMSYRANLSTQLDHNRTRTRGNRALRNRYVGRGGVVVLCAYCVAPKTGVDQAELLEEHVFGKRTDIDCELYAQRYGAVLIFNNDEASFWYGWWITGQEPHIRPLWLRWLCMTRRGMHFGCILRTGRDYIVLVRHQIGCGAEYSMTIRFSGHQWCNIGSGCKEGYAADDLSANIYMQFTSQSHHIYTDSIMYSKPSEFRCTNNNLTVSCNLQFKHKIGEWSEHYMRCFLRMADVSRFAGLCSIYMWCNNVWVGVRMGLCVCLLSTGVTGMCDAICMAMQLRIDTLGQPTAPQEQLSLCDHHHQYVCWPKYASQMVCIKIYIYVFHLNCLSRYLTLISFAVSFYCLILAWLSLSRVKCIRSRHMCSRCSNAKLKLGLIEFIIIAWFVTVLLMCNRFQYISHIIFG